MGQLVVTYNEIGLTFDAGNYVMERLYNAGAPVIVGESEIYLDPEYEWETNNCTETKTLTVTWSKKNVQFH